MTNSSEVLFLALLAVGGEKALGGDVGTSSRSDRTISGISSSLIELGSEAEALTLGGGKMEGGTAGFRGYTISSPPLSSAFDDFDRKGRIGTSSSGISI